MPEPEGDLRQSTSTPDGVLRNRQVDVEKLSVGPWDGRAYSYVPPTQLNIDPSISLHEDFETTIDPVTFQVLRSRFWNLNLDHSDTIKRVSGSPVIVFMDDFNTSLLTENGDTVVCGPSLQYFTGQGDLVVKWTLENRSSNPGIEDGDVFLQNDPYVGTTHQMDAALYAPIYWEGKLFSWIYSCCHVGDIGGVDPGSFCVGAPDMFHESTPVPPIKLARHGVLQADIHDMFVRKSRTPDMVALQLRSQLAGLHATKTRMLEMLKEYGAPVVKGVMRGMIRDCSEAVGERLGRIPDGEWQQTTYLGSAAPGDRSVHRLVTRLRKEGDRLIFSNEGTDPQFFAANCTFSAWRSANICAGSCMLAYDQLYCPAGVVDHMEFEPTPGTMNVATFPGAVTPITGAIVSVYLASQVISKMLLAAPEDIREPANASGGVSLPGWWIASGDDRHGNFVADLTGDSCNGSIGAFPHRDGVDTGGAWWWPRSRAGNAEEWESALPILYLYRREQVDSGGAGRWTGGNGLEVAFLSHKTDNLNAQIIAADPAINASPGLAGGAPGHSGDFLLARNTAIRELLARGQMPSERASLEQLVGPIPRLSPKANEGMTRDDILCIEYCAGGGFGDSLTRPPESVLSDIRRERITVTAARARYGVVVGEDGSKFDRAATERLRAELRARNLEAAKPPDSNGHAKVDPASVRTVAGTLGIAFSETDAFWTCRECGQVLADADENYKAGSAVLERNPAQIEGALYPEPSDFCDDVFVLREYLCPDCGAVLSAECCQQMDGPSEEVRLSESGLELLRTF